MKYLYHVVLLLLLVLRIYFFRHRSSAATLFKRCVSNSLAVHMTPKQPTCVRVVPLAPAHSYQSSFPTQPTVTLHTCRKNQRMLRIDHSWHCGAHIFHTQANVLQNTPAHPVPFPAPAPAVVPSLTPSLPVLPLNRSSPLWRSPDKAPTAQIRSMTPLWKN